MVLYRAWSMPGNTYALTPEGEMSPAGNFYDYFDVEPEEAEAFNQAANDYRSALYILGSPAKRGVTTWANNEPVGFTKAEAESIGYENLDRVASKLGDMTRDEALVAVVDELQLEAELLASGPVVSEDPPPIEEII